MATIPGETVHKSGSNDVSVRRRGFTLTEVLITMAVFGVVFSSVVLALVNSAKLDESSTHTMIAVADIHRVTEQMRTVAVTSGLSAVPTVDWPGWAAANGCTSLPSEQVWVLYADRDGSGDPFDDNPLAVQVVLAWQEHERQRLLTIDTLLTKR